MRSTDRLDRLKLPTIAVIHGYCLGGGLEIALACDYRIAIEDASLGFPEVLLGLHPGLGGTVRAPRLINPLEAMTMMLTGRTVRAGRAKSLGLVDAVTQERHVRAAVKSAVAGELKTARSKLLVSVFKLGPVPFVCRQAHAGAGARQSQARAVSGSLCADRYLGKARRRCGRHAEGRDRLVLPAGGRPPRRRT